MIFKNKHHKRWKEPTLPQSQVPFVYHCKISGKHAWIMDEACVPFVFLNRLPHWNDAFFYLNHKLPSFTRVASLWVWDSFNTSYKDYIWKTIWRFLGETIKQSHISHWNFKKLSLVNIVCHVVFFVKEGRHQRLKSNRI